MTDTPLAFHVDGFKSENVRQQWQQQCVSWSAQVQLWTGLSQLTFTAPPPLPPHLPGNLFSARLALGSPRSVTFALPQKPVLDGTKYFPLFRFATVVPAQCSSDTDIPHSVDSSLCLTVSCCCLFTTLLAHLSGFISCYACDASNHGHGGAQRQDQEDVQLEQ